MIDFARAAGVRIEPNGDKLRLRAPQKPSDELLDLLRRHKLEIIEHLRERGATGCARPPEPHRCCQKCGGGLQPKDPDVSPCFTCRWAGIPDRVQ